jgi:hypothetical protein
MNTVVIAGGEVAALKHAHVEQMKLEGLHGRVCKKMKCHQTGTV